MVDEYDEKQLQMQIAYVLLHKLQQWQKQARSSAFGIEEYRKLMREHSIVSKEVEKLTDDEVKEYWKDSAVANATAYAILKTVRYFLYHEPIQ